ncbi:hypothetical protein NG799_23205 [Laspinema sp. D1]|uniref:Uncharacterized protein n=1 Tax=Laspinema palackyanum D2a TaxID=2953684 RepID=A0ABT2MX09_9CYAN|nr:hypothetical protein [Laspinema sp. D2b]MCT7969228.1 hypothetical protein [Laspinema sp. D2a]
MKGFELADVMAGKDCGSKAIATGKRSTSNSPSNPHPQFPTWENHHGCQLNK